MCYSARIIQVLHKLQREMNIHLDYAEAEKLFLRRLDEPGLTISRGFEENFHQPATDQGRRIKAAIDEHRSRLATRIEKDLFTQKTRLVNAERALLAKQTKKAREDARIATGKIETLAAKLSDLRRTEPHSRDNRIFPNVYAGVIIKRDGKNWLTPMRYGCRPAGKPAFYDKKYPGLYNARRDNLDKFWREQFGHHHAIMVVERFYENVQLHSVQHRELAAGEQPRNVVLEFTPEPPQSMLIACLWSHWTDPKEPEVRGFAAITDEPPAAVAEAGHDRCIINVRREHVEQWLSPQGCSASELQRILSEPAVSTYLHAFQQAA